MMARRPEWSSVSEEYRYGLRDLTFNSKPIINNLTLFAQDHLSSAPALTRVLTDHLVSSPLEYKLPALYLIDSIVKNIGEPYVGLLSGLLPSAFSEAYRQLRDERTRRDFGRTLETWWNLFLPEVIRDIQQRAFTNHSALGPRKIMPIRERSVRPHLTPTENGHSIGTRPYPVVTGHHIPPRSTPSSSLPPPHHPNSQIYAHHPQFVSYVPTYPLSDNILRLLGDLRAAMLVPPERYNEKHVADIMYRLEYDCLSDPLLFRAVDERARVSDKRPLIDLIDSLIVFTSGTRMKSPSISLKQSRSPIPPQHSSHVSVDVPILPDVSPLLASLSSLPFNLNFQLPIATTIRPVYEDIIKRRSDAHNEIYSNLPRQCTNCGLRFPDTSEGQKKLEAHLDAHFRRNIRLKDKGKKVLARLWMQDEQDWIRNLESIETEKSATLFTPMSSSVSTTETNKKISMVRAGSDHSDRICHLCQEKIIIAWDDESDEWMYQDAIIDEDKQIVHASCLGK